MMPGRQQVTRWKREHPKIVDFLPTLVIAKEAANIKKMALVKIWGSITL